jgi:site-specific DNA-methyltransferase (adenine-specific)
MEVSFMSIHTIYFADNLPILQSLPSASIDLIYIDPPFNTGKVQARTQIKTRHSVDGDRVGFQGQRYETVTVGTQPYADLFYDFLGFIEPRLGEAHRLLKPKGVAVLPLRLPRSALLQSPAERYLWPGCAGRG